MEGLVQLRRRHRSIWPPLHLWDWAFEHGSLWCEELVPFFEGEDIPATRTFRPQALPSYSPVDPSDVRRQKAAAAAAEKKRQASIQPLHRYPIRTPSPNKRPGQGGDDSPSKRARPVTGQSPSRDGCYDAIPSHVGFLILGSFLCEEFSFEELFSWGVFVEEFLCLMQFF